MRNFGWMLASGALGALLAAGATTARAQTFEEALAGSYTTSPNLLAERARLRSTDEALPQALANWRPTVSVSGSAGRARVNETGLVKPQNFNPVTASAQVTQPLYRGGRTEAQTEQAKAQIQAERARLAAQEQSSLLDAATAYLNLLRDQATLDLDISNEQVLRTQLEATRDRFRVGEVTRTDVSQAEASLAGAVAARIQAEGTVNSARATFIRTTGITPTNLATPPSFDDKLPKTLEEAQTAAATDNPNVIAAQFDENASRNQIDLTAGQLLPQVNLVASYSWNARSQFNLPHIDQAEVVAQVSMPLYEAGATYSAIRQAKQQANFYRVTIDTQRRSSIEQATTAYQNLTSARAQLSSLKTQIQANTIALEGTRQEANVGSRTVLDVLNAEQTLLNSQVNLVQAQRDDLVAGYNLLTSVGRFSAEKLGLNVQLYDVEKNLNAVKGRWYGADIANPAQ